MKKKNKDATFLILCSNKRRSWS